MQRKGDPVHIRSMNIQAYLPRLFAPIVAICIVLWKITENSVGPNLGWRRATNFKVLEQKALFPEVKGLKHIFGSPRRGMKLVDRGGIICYGLGHLR